MSASSSAAQALAHVHARIAHACREAQRPSTMVKLLAVSKRHGPEQVRALYAAGQRAFGENYVQEGIQKQAALADLPDIVWHLIGPLQSNKSRIAAEHFDWVQSIDRLSIAERLSRQRPAHMPPLNVCVQVNVSGEASKSGVAPSEALALVKQVRALPRLVLRGLMTLPAPDIEPAALRAQFDQLAALFNEVRHQNPEWVDWDTLSMGMSDDLEIAIAAGSTLVRVGTALFGARPKD
ncbi:MAG: YggS family pyridoxal phosphate-dependent enzyme [Casimicrobiaceae bacterium]